jgi:hypothetical protein
MKDTIAFPSTLLKTMIFALLGWVIFQPDPVIAKIYKYKDDNGKVHFTDDASRIPLRYRKQGTVKTFKGVNEPTPKFGSSPDSSGQKDGKEDKGEKGLSSQDVALVNRTIQVFKVGIALSDRYKDVQPNFSNATGAIAAIQSGLPLKESLANDLAGTGVPELQQALGFLNQSIAADKETTGIGSSRKRRIVGILSRIVNEGKQQAGLIQKLEKALTDSKKKKAEAKRKKLEEAKKEFEKKKAETEKRQAEEAQ